MNAQYPVQMVNFHRAPTVKRTGETLKELARELRDHDRRITRIEAKWEAAVELSAGRGGRRRLGEKS